MVDKVDKVLQNSREKQWESTDTTTEALKILVFYYYLFPTTSHWWGAASKLALLKQGWPKACHIRKLLYWRNEPPSWFKHGGKWWGAASKLALLKQRWPKACHIRKLLYWRNEPPSWFKRCWEVVEGIGQTSIISHWMRSSLQAGPSKTKMT